jgi:hypothetical protein
MKTFSEWLVNEVEKVGITAQNPNAPIATATNQPKLTTPTAEEEAKKLRDLQKNIENFKKKLTGAAKKDLQIGSKTNPHQNLEGILKSQNPDDKAALLKYMQALATTR